MSEEVNKVEKVDIKKAWKRSLLKSAIMSIIFTSVTLFVLNFTPEGSQEGVIFMKNAMIGVFVFISFFVMIHIDFIVWNFKRAIKERDDYINYLEKVIDSNSSLDEKEDS